jgi:hypothetical protein
LSGTSWPLISTCGALPGEKIKSLTRVEARIMADSNAVVGMVRFATTFSCTGTSVAVSRLLSFSVLASVHGRSRIIV